MHILKDENGNPIPHGHDHEHCHEHEHCHAQADGNGPEHDHHHEHSGGGIQSAALLDYMWKHNVSHAAELDKMAQRLEDEGRADAAVQVRKAADEFQKGNLYLGLALSMLRAGV